ncbi:unnamed protein product [Hermetia illucens]|uniref:Uncharacterized protein n=1 Tax=Hermetia illucens TaxID=343691 RepID=A0A7R8UB61_HERIL|nr:unnamed protein product [Hermetia illucens]
MCLKSLFLVITLKIWGYATTNVYKLIARLRRFFDPEKLFERIVYVRHGRVAPKITLNSSRGRKAVPPSLKASYILEIMSRDNKPEFDERCWWRFVEPPSKLPYMTTLEDGIKTYYKRN